MSIKLKDTIYDLVNKSSSSTKATQDGSGNTITSTYLKLSGGTLTGNLEINKTSESSTFYLTGSSSSLRLFAWGDATYIETGNSDFSTNMPLKITGLGGKTGTDIYLNFSNIYCRGNNYVNIDSGNYSTYAATKDHNHDSAYAPKSHSHTNYVDLSSAQTISGKKTFSNGLAITGGATENTALPYFIGIEAYADGGTVKYISKDKVLACIGAASSGHTHSYLPLSGGIITGTLKIKRTGSAIQYLNESGTVWGWMGYDAENTAAVWNSNGSTKYTILHTGNWSDIIAAKNHSHSYLPLSGGVITSNEVGLTIKRTTTYPIISYYGGNTSTQSFYGALGFSGSNNPCYVDNTGNNVYTLIHSNNIGSYNAGSATKLQTSRTIWGQSFNGTGNVDGTLHLKASGNSFTQGIRIYQNNTSYAGILLGSKDLTALTSTDSNSWFICTDSHSNFSISKGGYLPTDTTCFGWDADENKWRINGASIIDVNTASSDSSSISLNSSKSCLKLFAWSDGSTYIESGNKDFSSNAQLNITGINGGQGSTLWLNFSSILCGASKHVNIHTGNIGNYVSSTSIPENLSVSNLGIKNTASNGTSGISLYGGCDFVTSYGILFTGTATYGGQFGDVLTGDWATYFTMDGGATTQGANVRGWIFRHKTGGNKVSIGADGNIQCTAWYRSIGSGGWYSETHGGGWYMSDGDWIRSYGSKPLHINIGSSNTWAAGGHRLAADFYGQDHVAIQLRNNVCSWSICSNGNRNLYFGYRNNSSANNTSGDYYPLYVTPDGTLYLNGQAITFTT